MEIYQPKIFGVIGLGIFGMTLAKQLSKAYREVIVLDRNEEKLKEARQFTDYAYVCEHLTKEAMCEAGIEDCDVVVICIGEQMDTSILTALYVQSLGVKKVFAKATSLEHGIILEKMGVEPLFPEQEAATWTARFMVSRNLLDYIPISEDIELAKIQVSEKLIGHSVAGIDFRQSFGLNIIALEHNGEASTEINPHYIFQTGDVIFAIGKNQHIRNLEDMMHNNKSRFE